MNFVVLGPARTRSSPGSTPGCTARSPGPSISWSSGSQHFLKGEYGPARDVLEQVLSGPRRSRPPACSSPSRSTASGSTRSRLAHAMPIYERGGDREAAKVVALDHAGLKDWTSALAYARRSSWPRRPRSPS
ncbi:MAG: hypothetical protein MZU79_04020 [Anaerotruncus sp.]|nr:hypothetical protein [Anaerotruncus sp.]